MCNRMRDDEEDDIFNDGILRDFPSESDIINWNEHNDCIPEEDDPTVLDILDDELGEDGEDELDEDDDEIDE